MSDGLKSIGATINSHIFYNNKRLPCVTAPFGLGQNYNEVHEGTMRQL